MPTTGRIHRDNSNGKITRDDATGKIIRDEGSSDCCCGFADCGYCTASATPTTLTVGISGVLCTPLNICGCSASECCQTKGTFGGLFTATRDGACSWSFATSLYIQYYPDGDTSCIGSPVQCFLRGNVTYEAGIWSFNIAGFAGGTTTCLGPCGVPVQTWSSASTAGDCMSPAQIVSPFTGSCGSCGSYACDAVIDITPNA